MQTRIRFVVPVVRGLIISVLGWMLILSTARGQTCHISYGGRHH